VSHILDQITYMWEFMEDGLSLFSRDGVARALDNSVKLVFPPMEKMSGWRWRTRK